VCGSGGRTHGGGAEINLRESPEGEGCAAVDPETRKWPATVLRRRKRRRMEGGFFGMGRGLVGEGAGCCCAVSPA